ncbi:MAG: hypothetical protein PHX30_02115 [Candidatus Pacebacteria bacterium]|nr:hypothetical protein [Candidatus Paceibacterota bacterium]
MIKPVNVTSLNASDELSCECNKCGWVGKLKLNGYIVNTDNDGNPLGNIDENCPECGASLNENI